MRSYVVEDRFVELPVGTLVGMSEEQFARRAHAAEPVAGQPGVYRLTDRVQFKRGEAIELDAVAKALVPALALAVTDESSVKDAPQPGSGAAPEPGTDGKADAVRAPAWRQRDKPRRK